MQNRALMVEEFWKVFQTDSTPTKRLELVSGMVMEREVTPTIMSFTLRMSELLEAYCRPRHLGHISSGGGYYRSRDVYNVRLADVAFVSMERTIPVVKQGFTPYMPDLVVLVHPSSAPMMEFAERALFFLQNGASLVWLLHPGSVSVDICTRSPKKSFRVYKVQKGGMLSGGDLLPGFTIEVGELFTPSVDADVKPPAP
ncbi:MAG: Uma2 family endonuclease [Armatimonadetes bacterium]|nr:Uma2 family endonuclease [Anaerolineae bacterium]